MTRGSAPFKEYKAPEKPFRPAWLPYKAATVCMEEYDKGRTEMVDKHLMDWLMEVVNPTHTIQRELDGETIDIPCGVTREETLTKEQLDALFAWHKYFARIQHIRDKCERK
jgi:hypothetical protein